jgi:hypothetical protein
LEFVGIIESNIGPAFTPKDTKIGIIRGGAQKFMEGCIIGQEFSGCAINKIGRSKKSFIKIFERHRGMDKKSKPHLHNVAMFAFDSTILLVGMGTRDM